MRFLIVTGLSGAGKTSAIKHLEDSGYQPKVQPWKAEDAQMLFTALLNAAREE